MQSKYEVLGVVGEGSYGIVYKCKNKKNNEFVAIKKFKEEEDDLVKKTISRELRVLQILKHDNIVEFKEAFKMKGNLLNSI
jgi:cyclin-dependent kinase-like